MVTRVTTMKTEHKLSDICQRAFIKRLWQHANVTRVVALAVVIMFAAFVLLLFLASLGDSALPPYDPPFPGERLGWGIVAAAAWPLVLVAGFLGHDPPFVLWFPLMLLGGAFWASLIETGIAFRHVRRA